MLARGALDPRFLADAADPFVQARRGVSRLASLATLEATRVDVVSAAEQRAEESNLRLGRRVLGDECEWRVHWPGQAIAGELHHPPVRAAPDKRGTTPMGTVSGTVSLGRAATGVAQCRIHWQSTDCARNSAHSVARNGAIS
jgi:hypothetical protein